VPATPVEAMDSSLASAAAIADQRQKIEQYRHILASVLSSSPPDISQAKRFLDHSNALYSRTLALLFWGDFTVVLCLIGGIYAIAVVSDEVPLVVSRQLLQTFAQDLGKLESDAQKEVAHYALTQIQPRVVSFEEQVGYIGLLLRMLL
jgi:COP9 signalosome complex subunit 4